MIRSAGDTAIHVHESDGGVYMITILSYDSESTRYKIHWTTTTFSRLYEMGKHEVDDWWFSFHESGMGHLRQLEVIIDSEGIRRNHVR